MKRHILCIGLAQPDKESHGLIYVLTRNIVQHKWDTMVDAMVDAAGEEISAKTCCPYPVSIVHCTRHTVFLLNTNGIATILGGSSQVSVTYM